MFNYEPRECDILEHPVGVGARLHPPLNLLYGIKDVPSEAGRLRAEPISFRRPRCAEPSSPLTRFSPSSDQATVLPTTMEMASDYGRAAGSN